MTNSTGMPDDLLILRALVARERGLTGKDLADDAGRLGFRSPEDFWQALGVVASSLDERMRSLKVT